jgi:hypothetical protein
MLKIGPVREPLAPPPRPTDMTARQRPLAAAAAALMVLLVGLLPSSAVALGPVTGSALGQVTHHHFTVPGIVRAEVLVAQELHPDAALWIATLAALALLGWVLFRSGRTAARPVTLPIPAGRDPPPAG